MTPPAKEAYRRMARDEFWSRNDYQTYRCPDCGRTEEQTHRGIEVHHQNGDVRDNRPENLVGVCRLCHTLREDSIPGEEVLRLAESQIAGSTVALPSTEVAIQRTEGRRRATLQEAILIQTALRLVMETAPEDESGEPLEETEPDCPRVDEIGETDDTPSSPTGTDEARGSAREFSERPLAPVFEDPGYLRRDWRPEWLPEREAEMGRLVEAFSPASCGKRPNDIAVVGGVGQGKTRAVEAALRSIESPPETALQEIWISAVEIERSRDFLRRTIKELTGAYPKGNSLDELCEMMFEEFNQRKGPMVLVIDDLESYDGDRRFFDELARAKADLEYTSDTVPAVVGIASDSDAVDRLDGGEGGTLFSDVVEFKPYDVDEVVAIIKRASKRAFTHEVPEEVIEAAVERTDWSKASVRRTARNLHRAGRRAAAKGDETVGLDHLEKAA